MRSNRILRQMAGVAPTAYDRVMRRHVRKLQREVRQNFSDLALLDVVARRQRGEDGLPPMPFQKMRDDLAKMAKGEM